MLLCRFCGSVDATCSAEHMHMVPEQSDTSCTSVSSIALDEQAKIILITHSNRQGLLAAVEYFMPVLDKFTQ